MIKEFGRKIVLEDGSEYIGHGFGSKEDRVCELVFDTSMVGYQEVVSNPAYTYQMVVMTYPLIGNYGITEDDYESKNPTIGGLIVRDYNDMPSNFRYTKTLAEVLEEDDIPGLYGIDTRKLTRAIRDKGCQRALITNLDTTVEKALEIIKSTAIPHDAVSKVSCKKRWYSRTSNHKFNVVVIDCGIKLSTISHLKEIGCNVTVVPYNTKADEIEFMNPDGVFVSDGPGNPKDVPEVVETVKTLRGKYPIFGVSLGHQLICMAYGAKVYKLKFGHRGGNHPVRNLVTNKIEIVNQNHGYAVDEDSLKAAGLTLTHTDIMDNTVEGAACPQDKVYSVQFHPERGSGPQSDPCLFDDFATIMEEGMENA